MNQNNPKLAADLHDLNERAKELRCLYHVNELLNRTELKLREHVDLDPQQRYRLVGVGLSNCRDSNEGDAQPGLFDRQQQ